MPGDALDGDVIDIHLVLAHEVEQEIERSLEDVEFDLVGRVRHGHRVTARVCGARPPLASCAFST